MNKTLWKLALAASLWLYTPVANANSNTEIAKTSKEIKNDNLNKLKLSFQKTINIKSFDKNLKKISDTLWWKENLLKILDKISNNWKNYSEVLKFFKANWYEEKDQVSDEYESEMLYILTKESLVKNNKTKIENKSENEEDKIITEAKNQTLNKIKLLNIENNWYEKLKEDLRDDINIKSFEETFKNISGILWWPENLLKVLNKISINKDSKDKRWTENLLNLNNKNKNLRDFSEVRKFFAANWYKTENNWLYEDEWKALYTLVKIFPENQKIYENYKTPFDKFLEELEKKWELTSDYKKFLEKNKEKIEISNKIQNFNKFKEFLFDQDSDWDIDSEKIVWVSEAQIFELTNIENFPYLLENLWISNKPEEFKEKIFTDIQLKRNFHKRLNLILWTIHNASPLFIKWWIEKFNKEYLKLESEFKEKIKEELSDEKIEKILKKKFPDNINWLKEKLTKKEWWNILNNIRLEWEAFSFWIVQWTGASINIENLTEWWLNNLNFWIANTPLWIIPVIWVSKNLFNIKLTDDWNTKLSSITWANIYKPAFFINIWIKNDKTEKIKELFQNNKEWWYFENFRTSWNVNYVNIFWVTWWIITLSLNISELDEKSFAWVEKMVQQMYPIMDNILNQIEQWTETKKLDVKKIFWNQDLTDKEISTTREKYQEIKNVYKLMTKWLDENEKLEIAQKLKRSAIQQYANNMHKKSEWLNFIWWWAWIAFIENYMPLPFLIITWEYNYSKIENTKDFFAEQASEKIISISNWNELWLETQKFWEWYILKIWKNHKWEKISEWVNFSAEKNLWIEIEKNTDWEFLISSTSENLKNLKDLFKNIKTKYFYDHDWKSVKIIFWKWYQNKNWEIIYWWWYDKKITRWLENKQDKIISDQIKMSEAVTEFEWIRNLVENMSYKMDKRYEKRIYKITENFRENPYNTANINSSWRKFLNSLEKNWSLKHFSNFKWEIEKITNQKQRQIILESIIHNVRSDQNLKWKSDNKIHSTYAGKEIPIKKYDTMIQGWRSESRSKVFTEQLSQDLWINENILNNYNNKYYKKLSEWQSSFNVNYLTKWDIITFIWTGKNKEIFPATSVTRYADINWNWNFEQWIDYLEIENQKITPEMVNLIPENVLNKYLNKIWWHLETNQRNLNFIKKLISWEKKIKWVEVKYELVFFKWWDCFNTSIWIKWLEVNINEIISWKWINEWKIIVEKNAETYEQLNRSVWLSWIVTGELEKKKTEKTIEKQKPNNTNKKHKNETTSPSNEDNINYNSESEKINNNQNKWNTIWNSIDNWIEQKPEITSKITVTQDNIDNTVWETVVTQPNQIENPNIDTWLQAWDNILQWTDNPISNINNPNTQATSTSTWDYNSNSDF